MKKRAYNTMLKKILVLISIIVLITQTIPIKVLAVTGVNVLRIVSTSSSNCTAGELRTELNKKIDLTGVSVSEEMCQKIINKIINDDATSNSICIEDDVIQIKVTSKETAKQAFSNEYEGPYSASVAELIADNGWETWIVVNIIESTNTSPSQDEEESQEEQVDDSVAKDLQTVLSTEPLKGYVNLYTVSLDDCREVIKEIEEAHSRNKVTSSRRNGKLIILMQVTSSGTVKSRFNNVFFGQDSETGGLIAGNNYEKEGLVVELINLNDIPEGEEDTRTPEQKIKDWIQTKHPSIDTAYLDIIVEESNREITYYDDGEKIKTMTDYSTDGNTVKYVAMFDEEQNVINVEINETYLKDVGVDDETIEQVYEEQNPDRPKRANLGGILAAPIFYLVNFIADAITSNLGTIMWSEDLNIISALIDTLGVLTKNKPDFPTENTAIHQVDIAPFLPNLLSGELYQYPNIRYTPEEIFAGKIELLSIDFISGKNINGEEIEGDWANIRSVVAQWYKVLRMIAIIGLLSALIYTGIKIILSANAKDKAKYKEWIINWIMAAAILFSMHYIMAFILSVTGEFCKLLGEACQGIAVEVVEKDSAGNVTAIKDTFNTNLMGLVRFMIQSENLSMKFGYEVMYIALIFYTIKFTFVYLKRVLNMAFLTLIAPIVALTYPIDKINDGKAQGFDMWIKEYTFNALLQPMHQILYYILVGASVSIAASNPIYGIVVLAFMSQSEKLLKKIFGFNKAGGGTVGGMAGAFVAGTVAKSLIKAYKGGGGSGANGADEDGTNELLDNPKGDKPGMDTFTDVFTNEDGIDQENVVKTPVEKAVGVENVGISGGENTSRYELENANNKVDKTKIIKLEMSDTGKTQNKLEKSKQSSSPIRTMAQRPIRGMKAVGKTLLKPAWDLDKSKSYNFKRLGKKAGRAALGAALGVGAAALQAGISITDGKYNPAEGLASFAAGYAGGGQLAKGMGGLYDTYQEGALPYNSDARKAEIMKRAKARFADRDDVIAFNKKNYPGQEEKVVERQRDNYLSAGITNLDDMKSGIKYANKLMEKGVDRDKADKQAAATIDFRKTLEKQGQTKAIYDEEKRKKYIDAMVAKSSETDKTKVRKQYENAFKSVVAYDAANE